MWSQRRTLLFRCRTCVCIHLWTRRFEKKPFDCMGGSTTSETERFCGSMKSKADSSRLSQKSGPPQWRRPVNNERLHKEIDMSNQLHHIRSETQGSLFMRDLSASVVVFLVALPLCMGI